MKDDASLLQSYVAEGSQEAFGELVRRHLGLVYRSALRQTDGDHQRAEDVAQLVFTDLARKADALSRRPLLVSWLHTSTRYAACHLRRTELRRRAREREAFAMNEPESDPTAAADWQRLRPLIDDALQSLGERDRAAVLLRFFENRSYAELGEAFSVSEDAARVRVNRALEKLRSILARHGLASTASALALTLAQPGFAAPPAGLAAQITASSLAATASTGFVGAAAGLGTVTFMSTVKIAATTAGALALLSVGVTLYQRPPGSAAATAAAPALSPAALAAILHPARLGPAEADAALAAYLALPPLASDAPEAEISARLARLHALLTILPAAHFDRLFATLGARTGLAEDRPRRAAFTVWTELDAPAAARWALAIVPGPPIDARVRRFFYLRESALAWGRADFSAAYDWTRDLADTESAIQLTGDLLGQVAATDPQRALALARAGGEAFFRAHQSAVFQAWAKHDPVSAVQTIGSSLLEANTPDPYLYLSQAVARWAERDPRSALDWMLIQPPSQGGVLRSILYTVSSRGPEDSAAMRAFIDLLAARDDVPDRLLMINNLFASWNLQDSAAALAWLDAEPDAARRADLIETVVRSSPLEPDAFLALVRRLPAGPAREQKIAERLATWTTQDPDAALAWLRAHDEPEFALATRRVEGALLAQLAATDPAAAGARWQALPPGEEKTLAATQLASSWSNQDPAAAARWLTSPPELRPAALSYVVQESLRQIQYRWAHTDPLGLLAWSETVPDIPFLRELAIGAVSGAGDVHLDPPPRAERADTLARISDPALRDQILSTHLKNWLRSDPQVARAWINSHDALSTAATARLLTP